MYNRSRAVWVTNAALFVVEWVVVLATYAKTSKGIHYLPYDVKCGLCDSRPKTLGYCYLPMLAYEFYLCALAMWKTFADRKHLAIGKNSILGVLVRDSVAYFLFVSSGLALSVTLFFAIPGVSQWTDLLLDSFGVIGGTRILFSTRQAALRAGEAPACSLETITALRSEASREA